MSMKKYEKLHYAWVILGCSILMAIAGFGVVGNVGGNFITPVVREFGTSVSSVLVATLTRTLSTISLTKKTHV